jgi:hypothetical protein
MLDTQGVTLITPMPTGWRRFNRYFLMRWVLRYTSVALAIQRFSGRSKRLPSVAPALEALNFIHFGRWIVLQQHPILGWRSPGLPRFSGQPRERPGRGFMIFISNFDEGWRGYVDTFMEATGDELSFFWGNVPDWGTPSEKGFEEFFWFVEQHSVEHAHYYAAFPDLATADIKAALAVDRHVRSFHVRSASMGDADWDDALEGLVAQLQRSLGTISRISPTFPPRKVFAADGMDLVDITSIAPFPIDDADDLHRAVATFTKNRESPFSGVPGTHFARIGVIDKIRIREGFEELKSAYVLLSVDADGTDCTDGTEGTEGTEGTDGTPGGRRAWLGDLFDQWSLTAVPGTAGSLIDLVWGSCYGFAEGRDRESFIDYIISTSYPATVPFSDYPRTTLWDIHRAVDTHAWFTDFVFARAGRGKAEFSALIDQSLPVDAP